jgi:hypothetical protein
VSAVLCFLYITVFLENLAKSAELSDCLLVEKDDGFIIGMLFYKTRNFEVKLELNFIEITNSIYVNNHV